MNGRPRDHDGGGDDDDDDGDADDADDADDGGGGRAEVTTAMVEACEEEAEDKDGETSPQEVASSDPGGTLKEDVEMRAGEGRDGGPGSVARRGPGGQNTSAEREVGAGVELNDPIGVNEVDCGIY
ncbi:unnamed protein product [Lampetra fluviatilis]